MRFGAAISLQHIAIQCDRPFSQRCAVNNGTQRSSDQSLNFQRAATLFTTGRFPRHAASRGTRQHAVFRCDPAFALAAQKRRDPFLHRRRAKNVGVTTADQNRTLRVAGVVPLDNVFLNSPGDLPLGLMLYS